jgi:hypothetical protein
MDVGASGQGVAPSQGPVVVIGVGNGDTGTDGVAGPKQGAQIGFVGHPQGGDHQVVPTRVLNATVLVS